MIYTMHVSASQVIAAGLAQPLSRIPELYAGYTRDAEASAPVPYPVSCSPQAWSAASAYAFVQAMIGLDVDGRTGEIRCTPHLPPWLSTVRVRGLRFGRTQADDQPCGWRVYRVSSSGCFSIVWRGVILVEQASACRLGL